MTDLLPFVVAGLTTGAIYGLAATGLVLTYKTSGIFNFGHGALATAGAYVFYWLHVDYEWDWKIAAGVAVLVVGPLLGLMMELIARQLSKQPTAWKIVGTTGLILLVQGLGVIRYGTDPRRVPRFLPGSGDSFRVFDVNVSYDQVVILGISVAAVLALYVLFAYTRLGIAMRAVVDDPDLLDLQGTSPTKVRRTSWIIGSTLASLSGVLIVPQLGLDSIALTFLVVQAFGAAAVGLFSSIPLTFVGGLLIGVLSDVTKKFEIDYTVIRNLGASVPFIILFIVLLVAPKRKLVTSATTEARAALQWHGPLSLRIGVGVVVFGVLATVPNWAGTNLFWWTTGLSQIILILSLGLLIRTAGIVSLCQATFAAFGAVAASTMIVEQDVPWILAVLLAGLVAVPIGAALAVPTVRLSGIYLALATLGFGVMVERLLFGRSWMFTEFDGGKPLPRPSFATSGDEYYYVVLGFALAAVLVVSAIHRGRLGRILRGMGNAPTAVSTLGLSLNVTRVIVFCISAYMAGVAGALHAGTVTVAVSSDRYFQTFTSLVLVAILALAPFRQPWYGVFAGVVAVIPGYWDSPDAPHWLNVVFGFFAIVIALQGGPHGMPVKLQHVFERIGGTWSPRRGPLVPASETAIAELLRSDATHGDGSGLVVEGLTVRFGGLVAVDNVSLRAEKGTITGLIGPNGAGKTTTFNACSGLNAPTHGDVLLHGTNVSGMSPSARARLGLGRTFQVMELGEALTVRDNVALGREASQAGALPQSQIFARPAATQLRELATDEAMELCGVTDIADLQAGALSTGQRRLVELARCLAGPFDILLLDEPSSGLDKEETDRFGALLQHIVEERGCGILLVEHDMSLVMDVCSYVYVLDFGKLIFDGPSDAVATSDIVRSAYLGDEPLPIENPTVTP